METDPLYSCSFSIILLCRLPQSKKLLHRKKEANLILSYFSVRHEGAFVRWRGVFAASKSIALRVGYRKHIPKSTQPKLNHSLPKKNNHNNHQITKYVTKLHKNIHKKEEAAGSATSHRHSHPPPLSQPSSAVATAADATTAVGGSRRCRIRPRPPPPLPREEGKRGWRKPPPIRPRPPSTRRNRRRIHRGRGGGGESGETV